MNREYLPQTDEEIDLIPKDTTYSSIKPKFDYFMSKLTPEVVLYFIVIMAASWFVTNNRAVLGIVLLLAFVFFLLNSVLVIGIILVIAGLITNNWILSGVVLFLYLLYKSIFDKDYSGARPYSYEYDYNPSFDVVKRPIYKYDDEYNDDYIASSLQTESNTWKPNYLIPENNNIPPGYPIP